MGLDLLAPLRTSVIEAIGPDLPQWKGEPAVFTRRPTPEDAPTLCALVNPPGTLTDRDALNSDRPYVEHDIAVYGRKGAPGSAEDETRIVEQMGFSLRDHFHRQKWSVQPEGFRVISITARGPFVAPVDDDQTVGRIVALAILLRREQ